MRAPLLLLALGTTLMGLPMGSAAMAQDVPAIGPQDTEKVKQVFVYGDDPCPASSGDEIVVCARMPDNERYRIPKDLRTDPLDPKVQSWANRARSIEYVGREGIDSCSPTGGGGFTGCFQQIARAAREERQTMLGSATWADAVEKARSERLGNLDAESEEIEQQAREEEAEAARLKAAQEAQQKKQKEQGPREPQPQ
ncbi:hypothetical protein [Sphingobium lignivorans]|uniref:Uncharacterized protein n=1 Tax=Sphingobium lignivorans TaxID=2735886 RepID=A0ABR6NKY4_9SPHN|nr:hypothetical protein [Sphingobium lignivorans]MBB5987158.1 hypothetical protein [Sphingobium lignivorans]